MPDAYMPRFFSREGRVLPGEKRSIVTPVPAAGGPVSVTVPGGRQWRIQGGQATLTTSAAVVNRVPRVTVTDGTFGWWTASLDANVPAGTVQAVTIGPLAPQPGAQAVGFSVVLPIPDMFLPPGCVVTVGAGGEDAGDQFSAMVLMVEELWLDDQMVTMERLDLEAIEAAIVAARNPTSTGG